MIVNGTLRYIKVNIKSKELFFKKHKIEKIQTVEILSVCFMCHRNIYDLKIGIILYIK